jgi:hypothetical protein
MPSGGLGSAVLLNARQETHDVSSEARGTASILLTDAGAVFHATTEGLTGPITAAHFHGGAFGMNGGPVRTITDDFDANTARGLWSVSDPEPLDGAQLDALLAGIVYLNIHTSAYGSGEIRGQINPDGPVITSTEPVTNVVPSSFVLAQNYPNPFNPSTAIRFDLAEAGHVSLAVYDMIGRKVAMLIDSELPARQHEVIWNASGLPSGVYFYTLQSDGFRSTRSMLLVE